VTRERAIAGRHSWHRLTGNYHRTKVGDDADEQDQRINHGWPRPSACAGFQDRSGWTRSTTSSMMVIRDAIAGD
jgi:hypothetical protein